MRILLTGAYSYSNEQIAAISSLGFDVCYHQNEREIADFCESYDAVVCNGLFLNNDIRKFKNLKYIQLTSAGYDRVPMDYIKEHGIKIFNARGVYSIPMAEFAVSGVLQMYKQSRFFAEHQKLHKWEKHRGLCELYGKNVLIVGCGSVGDECAKRFSAFGCTVFGVDVLTSAKPYYKNIYPLNNLEKYLKISDVVILTLPLTEETRHLIDGEKLKHFKSNSILVNIARGAIIDTSALICALKNKLFGAVLDVFEDEPLDEKSELWDMKNVIITPHNSFVGEGNSHRLFNLMIYNLEKWMKRYE